MYRKYYQTNFIAQAGNFAGKAHEGQLRKYTGSPYIVHPERVAMGVSEYTNNENVIAAAWLHDVVEDCNVTHRDITDNFGSTVSLLVWEVTNPSKALTGLSRKYRKKLDREHIAQGSPEAQLIKILDRIDNLMDLPKEDSFYRVYKEESKLLLEVLTLAPESLQKELEALCTY